MGRFSKLLSLSFVFLAFMAISATSMAQNQIVSPSQTTFNLNPGDEFAFTVSYDVSDGDNTLTGLGLAVYYNSSVLEWRGFSNELRSSLFQESSEPQDDTDNGDNDADTDKMVLIAWVDFAGNWPNTQLPVDLFSISFKVKEDVQAPTQTVIRIGATSTAAGYGFQTSPVTVNVSSPQVVTHTLSINKGGEGTGTVTSNPAGIDCGDTCQATFDEGTQVTLTAEADEGSVFSGWGGDCANCGSNTTCTVTMNSDLTCTANFAPQVVTHTLSINPKPSHGTVTSNPAGINCGSGGDDCSEEYAEGTNVTLTATADDGYVFSGWTGDCEGCEGNTCTVTMDADVTCSANFTQQVVTHTLSINKGGEGTGTVTSNPAGIDCGDKCQATFDEGTQVTLTAEADEGSVFSGWGGDCANCGSNTTCTVTMNSDLTCTANFALLQPNISVSPTSWNFGRVAVGGSSDPKVFTVSNTGSADLSVTGIGFAVTDGQEGGEGPFVLDLNGGTNPCGSGEFTLEPGSSCTFTVTFSPQEEGSFQSSLRVTSNDPDTPSLDIQLSGEGFVPGYMLHVSWVSLRFIGPDRSGRYTAIGALSVSNSGASLSPVGSMKVYLSSDDVLDDEDTLVSQSLLPRIFSGATVRKIFSARITPPSGNFYLIAVAEAGGQASDPAPREVQGGVDLVPQWISLRVFGPDRRGRYRVRGAFRVTNQGQLASGTFYVQVYYSEDDTLDDSDTPLLRRPMRVGRLGAGRSRRGRFFRIFTEDPRDGHFFVKVDIYDSVTETDEDNNVSEWMWEQGP